jgi:hypothetical protein
MLLLDSHSLDKRYVHRIRQQLDQGNDESVEVCTQKLLDSSSEERSCPALS